MYIFEIDRIQYLMRHFHKLTNLSCHIYSHDQDWINADTTQHTPLCELIQTVPDGLKACLACDACGFAEAARKGQPILYRCHAGLTECVVPVQQDNRILGFLTFGRTLCYETHEEAIRNIFDRCGNLGLPEAALREACLQSNLVSMDYLEAAEAILSAIASYIVLEQLYEQKQTIAAELDQYLNAHFTEALTADQICRALNIGKTQLYKLSNSLYGQGIAQRLREMRLHQAKRLLTRVKSMSVGEVAFACGFSNYNHFIKVFSREVGMPPNRYRKCYE